eukprot:140490-Chlamydomonas_euryale.AAC.2
MALMPPLPLVPDPACPDVRPPRTCALHARARSTHARPPCTRALHALARPPHVRAPSTHARSRSLDLQLLDLARKGRLSGPKWFLGGSTAALRHCALLSSLVLPGGDRPRGPSLTHALKEHFVAMTYRHGDTPATLAPMM